MGKTSPDYRDPTPTQPLLQPMPLQLPINYSWQSQADHDPEQKRKIIQRFCGYFQTRVHPLRLPDNLRFHRIFQQKDGYNRFSDIA
jgi:hypothetical protein